MQQNKKQFDLKKIRALSLLSAIQALASWWRSARSVQQGLVHRDVKPSNILLEQGVERAFITDFGPARAKDDVSLTQTGYHPGTPKYMSPEQARGDAVDGRSDLFSFGSVLYAMCTGHAPFRAETSYGILRRIIDTEPRPIRELNPSIPEWLCAIISKLMSKQPDSSMAVLSEAVEIGQLTKHREFVT